MIMLKRNKATLLIGGEEDLPRGAIKQSQLEDTHSLTDSMNGQLDPTWKTNLGKMASLHVEKQATPEASCRRGNSSSDLFSCVGTGRIKRPALQHLTDVMQGAVCSNAMAMQMTTLPSVAIIHGRAMKQQSSARFTIFSSSGIQSRGF